MERREYPRFQVRLQIEVREIGAQFASHGDTTNVSLGGCYVATLFPLAAASKVEFVMWLGEEAVRGQGTVRTCHPGVGMGIEFRSLSREIKRRLDCHLRTTAPVAQNAEHYLPL